MRYRSRLIALPLWSVTRPGWAVPIWVLCVAVVTVLGRHRLAAFPSVGVQLYGLPALLLAALLLAALLVCGTVGAAVVLALVAAGTAATAVALCPPADGPYAGGAAAGLVIVYAAALVGRCRAERAGAPRYAARVTISTTGGVVVAAGLVVALPAAVTMSVPVLIATLTALGTAVTVVPALLAWYGGPARFRRDSVAPLLGRLAVRHPAPVLASAALLLAVGVATLRIADIPFQATIPALSTLPVPVLLLAARVRAATLTGVALRPAIEWAVSATAPVTVVAAAGAGCVFAVSDPAAGIAVLCASILVVAVVPALISVGRSAQYAVSAASVRPAMLASSDDGDGGGVPWRK